MKIQKCITYQNENHMPYLVYENTSYTVDGRTKHDNPQKVYELVQNMRIPERATETVLLFIFDNATHLICYTEISTGTIDRSVISPREIAQTMLLSGGVTCILVHNHPSGDTTPSKHDINITNKISDALQMLSLRLVDHLVVGRGYTSMAELGYV